VLEEGKSYLGILLVPAASLDFALSAGQKPMVAIHSGFHLTYLLLLTSAQGFYAHTLTLLSSTYESKATGSTHRNI
jgi:hypothetical protein